MRPISAELAAVQAVRSPRARVTASFESRGQNPSVPALSWAEVVSNVGQTVHWPTALVGLANGTVLKFVANIAGGGLLQYTIANPDSAASWTGATPVTRVAGLVAGVAALRVPATSTIRVWYILNGNVYYIQSANNGSTWAAAVTVYAGGAATGDLAVAYIANGAVTNGPWFYGFSAYNGGTGVYSVWCGYWNGSAWEAHMYPEPGWRMAGFDAYAPAAIRHRVLLFRARGLGTSRLRAVDKAGVGWTNTQDIDQTQAGYFGLELAFYRFLQCPGADNGTGFTLGICGEAAFAGGVYIGVGGIFTSGSDPVADEPIMFPSIRAVSSLAYAAICEAGGKVFLAGDTVVWLGSPQAAPQGEIEVIRYEYRDHVLNVELKPGISNLAVGQILVLTRTLSWEALSGSEVVQAIVTRVERGVSETRVRAVDAVGWLARARCRRPAILNDGSVANVARVMRRLAARFGIPVAVDNSALESGAVMPFTLAPAESLLGAAYRVGSQTDYYLVPNNDGSFGLTMITPGTSGSGEYADTPAVYGVGQQPVADAGEMADYDRLAFAYVLGSWSTDPEDGGIVAMARGPVLANTRPLSYSLTNMRYNTAARVQAAASAEAARQSKLPVVAWMEGQANLALEPYDVVEVTEGRLGWAARRFRVREIVEKYDRGLLTQKVWLGEV